MQIHFQHAIRGYLVGPIWNGSEAYKDLSYDLTREAKRMDGASFRDHVLAATNDGDFRHCALAWAQLVTEVTITKLDGRVYRRTVSRDLDGFASVADMVDLEWEGPSFPEDEDE